MPEYALNEVFKPTASCDADELASGVTLGLEWMTALFTGMRAVAQLGLMHDSTNDVLGALGEEIAQATREKACKLAQLKADAP